MAGTPYFSRIRHQASEAKGILSITGHFAHIRPGAKIPNLSTSDPEPNLETLAYSTQVMECEAKQLEPQTLLSASTKFVAPSVLLSLSRSPSPFPGHEPRLRPPEMFLDCFWALSFTLFPRNQSCAPVPCLLSLSRALPD